MRLRVSVRWLMLLVALSALCVGPVYKYFQSLITRSREYTELAKMSASAIPVVKAKLRLRRLTAEERRSTQELLDWHLRRVEAYTRAASRPWTTVTDEPRPEVIYSTPAPYVAPPLRKSPKPPGQMTEGEKLEYGRQLVKDIQDEGKRLMDRGNERRAIMEEVSKKAEGR